MVDISKYICDYQFICSAWRWRGFAHIIPRAKVRIIFYTDIIIFLKKIIIL